MDVPWASGNAAPLPGVLCSFPLTHHSEPRALVLQLPPSNAPTPTIYIQSLGGLQSRAASRSTLNNKHSLFVGEHQSTDDEILTPY